MGRAFSLFPQQAGSTSPGLALYAVSRRRGKGTFRMMDGLALLPIPEWFDPTQIRDSDGERPGGLRPSEVVRQTNPDPAEQAPLVARSVTPPSASPPRRRRLPVR